MSKKKSFKIKKNKKEGRYLRSIIEILLENPRKPMNYKQISSALGLTNSTDKENLIKDIQKLLSEKQVKEIEKGKYLINEEKGYLTGIIDITSSGSAYVTVEGIEKDIYIPKDKKRNSLQNDKVKIFLLPNKRKKFRQEAEVVEIIERYKTEFTGIFEPKSSGKYAFVSMDTSSLHVDFYIPKGKFGDAEEGDKVVVKMTGWPEGADNPFGEITRVLGNPKESEVEIHSILLEYGLPYKFSEEVENEANNLDTSIEEEEIIRRKDMRSVTTFTIDPKDAKDFDDALSVRKLENGNWEIGVHIADVSHYVRPGTLLDKEAYERANSVYLVDRVVPMLPEILSNEACSLRPDEDKYTFSAIFEMNAKADVINSWFGKTVIRSDRRFSYEEAQEIIEGKKDKFEEEMLILNELAKILRKKRMKTGAISFDKIEVKFNLDEQSNPIGVYFKTAKEANHLIEEFMLLCNRKVSEFVSLTKDDKASGNTYIYRIHDDPDMDKLQDLRNFIKQFGYTLDLKDRKSITKSMNRLLEEVKGKPEENMIETLAMRTMSKAKYSTENIGHYGLAFDYYTHFTSPIRRYPDVLAHRLLERYLNGKKSTKSKIYEEECLHCSSRERLSIDAERDSIKYMQVKYMSQFVGEEFYGFITGVRDYGIFVEIPENHCEGMIRLRNMQDDNYYFDEKNYSIVGKKTKKIYQLGDKVLIKVVNADIFRKKLDFELVTDVNQTLNFSKEN